jgi:hypothetical protein
MIGFDQATVWDGSDWSAGAQINHDVFSSVSCTRTFCVAGTHHGSVVTYRDGHFSAPQRLVDQAGRHGLGVSCARGPYCLAYVKQGVQVGAAFELVHGQWAPAGRAFNGAIPGADLHLELLSCANRSLCVAARHGSISTWDGKTWTAADPITHGNVALLSCAGRAWCVAITHGGRALIGRTR